MPGLLVNYDRTEADSFCSGGRLQFKSALSQDSTSTLSEPAQGHLHLCSDDKVWAVKQVSTSNSVYITRVQSLSYHESHKQLENGQQQLGHTQDEGATVNDRERPAATGGDADNPQRGFQDIDGDTQMETEQATKDDDDQRSPQQERSMPDRQPQTGITAISQVKNILELVEVKPDDANIEASIRALVPVYDDPERDGDDAVLHMPKAGTERDSAMVTRNNVLDNIPAPSAFIIKLLEKLFVFSIPRPQGQDQISAIFIPTSYLLLRAWKTFVQQCTISGAKLDACEGVSSQQLEEVFRDMKAEAATKEDGNVTVVVTRAILRQFFQPTGDDNSVLESGSDGQSLDQSLDLPGKTLAFKDSDTREAVGSWVLLSLQDQQQHSSTIPADDFIRQWTELLPDSWAQDCDLKSLVHSSGAAVELARESGTEVLRFSAPAGRGLRIQGANSGVAGPVTPAVKADATKGQSQSQSHGQNQKKRKWHEKFAAQRSKVEK